MKDKIKDLLTRMTAQYEPGPRSEFTTAWLAQQTSLSRNAASEYLNQLCQQRQAVKINTRPVYYLSVAALRTKGYGSKLSGMSRALSRCSAYEGL